MNTVSRYDTAGYVEDLPSLNEGRWNHGCGVYSVSSGDQVSITLHYTILLLLQILSGISGHRWIQ